MVRTIAGALLTIAGAYSIGSLVTRRAGADSLTRFAIGTVLLSYLIFGLLLLRWAKPLGLITLGALAVLSGGLTLRLPRWRVPNVPPFVLAVLALYTVLYAAHAMAPEIETDPNAYHLQTSVEAAEHGGLGEPITFYSRMPHSIELLFVMAYAVGGAASAKLVHFAFLAATIPLILALAERFQLPPSAGYLAAAFYYVTPVVGVSGTSAFNDAALVFYLLLSVRLAMENRPVLAGIIGGFCYAVKMTGIIAAGMGLIRFAAARQWKRARLFAGAAILVAAPWTIWNFVGTGNPLAPVANALFPNQYFHASTERTLVSNLRSYGVEAQQRPSEVLAGHRLQGVIGPVYLLAPIALLALRRREGRALLLLAGLASLLWFLNAGARFLMPAIPFLVLAMMMVLPRPAAYAALFVHAVLSWPAVVGLYQPLAWRLSSPWPWKAALGLESEAAYLSRVSWDYRVAQMIEKSTGPGARIFDLLGVHAVHIRRELVGSWQSAEGDRLVEALKQGRGDPRETMEKRQADFGEVTARGVRITTSGDAVSGVQEIELYSHRQLLNLAGAWMLEGQAGAWEMPFAFDRNLTSGWKSWQDGVRHMSLTVHFDKPTPITAIAVTSLRQPVDREILIEVQNAVDARWRRVESSKTLPLALNLRREAVRFLKNRHITHIVAPLGEGGAARLAADLVENPGQWGLEKVGSLYGVYVMKIR